MVFCTGALLSLLALETLLQRIHKSHVCLPFLCLQSSFVNDLVIHIFFSSCIIAVVLYHFRSNLFLKYIE